MFHFRIYKPSISAVLENILKLSKSKHFFLNIILKCILCQFKDIYANEQQPKLKAIKLLKL